MTVAKQPLTLPELQEAIAVEPLQQMWDARNFVNNMHKAVACYGNLVFVEEEEQTVHFTHSSVKQYLISQAISERLPFYYINLEEANLDAGTVCVTYLNFNIFNTQITHASAKSIEAANIPSTVMKQTLPLSKIANRIALSLLTRQDKSSTATDRLLKEILGENERRRGLSIVDQYPFLSYARKIGLSILTDSKMEPDSFGNYGAI